MERMMKKKVVAIVAVVMIAAMSMFGCAQQTENNEPEYMDEAFLSDLGKGLEARWDLNEQYEKENPDGLDTSESMKSYVQAELDAVGGYANAQFEDSRLREYAVSYINILNDCLEAADSYNPNNIDSLTKWSSLYDERTMLLQEIFENYEVTISEEHQSNLNDVLSNGKAAQKTEEVKTSLQAIADSAQFAFEPDEFGNVYNGTATVTNNTGMDFATVTFDVQMYDENGVRTESTVAAVNNWGNGETVVLTAYLSSGVVPASVKVVPNYYEVAE